jgi:flagellar hook assembly protein FlgD
MLLMLCSTTQGDIGLTVNGDDPAASPLQLESSESIAITLVDPNSTETSYDLTLSATGGVLSCQDPNASSESTVHIQTSDLDTLDTIDFELGNDAGVAVISLTTNQALTIDGQTVSADTEIYQLILFNTDDKIVVFGVNYASLSYTPPVQVQATPALMSITSGLEPIGMESYSYSYEYESTSQTFSYQTFSDPNENPDLDDDHLVNFKDFAVFSGNWLDTGTGLDGDFDQDGTVDVNDLIHFSTYWLCEVRQVLYVDSSADPNGNGSSWASAYKYLKDALTAASSGYYEIWLADGTYKPGQDASHTDGDSAQTFTLPTHVCLLGGFGGDPNGETDISLRDISEHPTILSGNANGGNCAVIITASEDSIIDSFKITGASSEAVSSTSYAPLIRNCLIYDNGAGVTSTTGNSIIDNCTLVGNTGYAVESEDAYAFITNSILWGNNSTSNEYQNCQVTYSCIEDGCIGSTNIAWVPYFEDVSGDDYHLKTYSPCIDTADPAGSYDKEPSGGGGRLNMGVYGNTAGAALKSADTENSGAGDGLPDTWETAFLGTTSYGPDDDVDEDDFTNLIEYRYGYDPNDSDTESAAVTSVLVSTSEFDPANDESVNVSVYLNKAETITVNFINTDNATEACSITQAATAGNNNISWDGTDDNNDGNFVERAFYNIEIENSSSTVIWQSSVVRETTPQAGANDEDVEDTAFLNNPYQNQPVIITSDRTDWHRRTIEVELTNDTLVKTVVDNALLEGNGTQLEWSGHWGRLVFENSLCHDAFTVSFGTPTAVNVGTVLVDYQKPISNLTVNPYRILISYGEFATISYDLVYDDEVTVHIYDTNMNLFRSFTEQQSAGPNTIVWDGTDANGKYIQNEGTYTIEIVTERFGEEKKALGTLLIFQ